MSAIVSHIEIARPPAEVFAYVTDPSRFHEWQHDVVRVDIQGDGLPGVGSRFITTRRLGGAERAMTQEITELTPPRHWVARGVDGAVRPSADVTVEPLEGGTRSRVTIALELEGHGFGKLMPLDVIRRMAAKGGAKSYQNLKERLEQGHVSPTR
jgi:uncharacterized protein YndB with AHSA1/START domain